MVIRTKISINWTQMAAHRNLFLRLLLLVLIAMLCSCGQKEQKSWKAGLAIAEDTISYLDVFGEWECNTLIVSHDADLQGKLCTLPKGVTLSFQGGVIKNGTLVGDGTKIESQGVCFDKVRILGTWDVPEISSSMFKDLDYDNSLKDVVALANPDVENRIVIEKGDYQVSALRGGDVCVPVCSNTELLLNGTIRMTPNDFEGCDIVRAWGNQITMTGTGTIVGDKHTHTGNTGEWGMGIEVMDSHNVTISELTIKDCWGDCIYVGEGSTNVLIENCLLDHGRRQGISITAADRVTIKDCTITNVAGTAPEYGIEVEPNGGDVVDHVMIENVTVRDSKGGFLVYGRAADARVGKVIIRNCDVSADKKITVAADKCDTLIVQDCDITQHNTWGCISCSEVGHVEVMNNTLRYDKGVLSTLKDWARPRFGKKRVEVIEVKDCETTVIVRNQECKL